MPFFSIGTGTPTPRKETAEQHIAKALVLQLAGKDKNKRDSSRSGLTTLVGSVGHTVNLAAGTMVHHALQLSRVQKVKLAATLVGLRLAAPHYLPHLQRVASSVACALVTLATKLLHLGLTQLAGVAVACVTRLVAVARTTGHVAPAGVLSSVLIVA